VVEGYFYAALVNQVPTFRKDRSASIFLVGFVADCVVLDFSLAISIPPDAQYSFICHLADGQSA
jgi:hypothetical protein